MSKTCFVCKVPHLEMISIFQHPEKLDSILNYLLELKAKEDDYLCKDCCEEVINAFKSEQKFNQSNVKSPLGEETFFKEEINFPGQIEAMISQVPEVKIEQNNEEPERSFDELTEGTDTKKLIEQLRTAEDTKEKPETQRGFVDPYKDESDTAKNDEVLKEVAIDADLEQISDDDNINCRDKLKAESLSDVEVSSDEFELNGEKEKIKYSLRSSKLKDKIKENEVVLKEKEEEPIVYSNEKSINASFTCCSCFKTFITSSKLKRHERTHTGKKPYTCSYCSKTFSLNANLRRHIRTHTKEQPYECSECGKKFTYSSDLKKHGRTHIGERPYTCLYCSKTFAICSALSSHARIHTNECSVCGKCFLTFSGLKKHRSTHTYACSYCPKSFRFKSSLNIHVRRHKNQESLNRYRRVHTKERFACHECSKTFSTSSNLSKHKHTHTKKKLFECSQCEESFVNLPSLKRHRRIHTGKIPCLYCSKTFKKSSNHLIHIQTKHAKEVNVADSEKKLHQSNPQNPKSPMSDVAACNNEIDLADDTDFEISSSDFEREIKSECKDELENMLKT